MSEYNKILNRDSSVSNLDSKDYPYGLDSISLPNQENQGRNQDNPGRKSSNQANQDKIKVQTFKQTELGLIPDDWDVIELDSILQFGNGQDYKHLPKGEIPVYGTGGIMTFVNDYLYDGKSVGIGRKGTIDKPVFLSGKFWTVDTLFYTHSFVRTIPEFIYYKFLTIPWKGFNEASGVPSLNKNTLGKIKIPLPPLPEQKAIAQVLSDTDSLIQTLEQKLAKKRAIKQGVMQQLLTPKEGWEVRKLGEICDVRDGTHDSPKYVANGVKFITSKNIIDGKLDFTEMKYISLNDAFHIDKRSKVDKGDILMSMIGTIGNAVLVDYDPDFSIKNVALIKMKNSVINPSYLIQLLYSDNFQDYMERKLDGGIQKFISLGVLRNLEIPSPTETEQTRIATILSDMDAEIGQLEQKLDKYKLLKQGLMQELLTGRIRLI